MSEADFLIQSINQIGILIMFFVLHLLFLQVGVAFQLVLINHMKQSLIPISTGNFSTGDIENNNIYNLK